jgi:hypothetical protein
MLLSDRTVIPVLAFLAIYLPAGAIALGLGLCAAPHAPLIAAVLQIGLGAFAFAVAVDGAANWFLRRPGHRPLIQRILHLRRNRLRFALVFALLGASVAGLADLCAGACGITLAASAGPGRIAVGTILLFALASVIIGSAGDRQSLIRRALGEALATRP